MIKYTIKKLPRKWHKTFIALLIILLVVGAGSAVFIRRAYNQNLRPINSSEKSQIITIPVGTTTHEIAVILEDSGIIRKSWAFEWFVRSNGAREDLKAGTYSLKPSQSVADIFTILTHGKETTNLVTIFPAKRIDEVRDDLINQGFAASDVEVALSPSSHPDHPALVDKPKEASLEGYLYPESFAKAPVTTASDIVRAALDQMHNYLTPEVRAGFVRQGLTVHEGVTLASIIEQEVGSKDPQKDIEDKKQVAQVFLLRLKNNMPLQSDATTDYGAVLAGEEPHSGFTSLYNTYQNKGLIPGPISNAGKNSLNAVASPAQTDFLYFVSGDNGVNYFSRTLDEHTRLVREHCSSCR